MSTYPSIGQAGKSRIMIENGSKQLSIGTDNLVFLPGTVDTIGFYAKASSAVGVSDGIIRVWRNRKLVQSLTGLVLTKASTLPGAFNGFGNGYLLGWANSGFAERTEFHLWRFVLAPAPLPWFLPPTR